MKAITKYKYGGPEVLALQEVEKPIVKEGHLLIKVKANSVNPADWHVMRGEPIFSRFALGLLKPTQKILGADFSGTVQEVGSGTAGFKVGDRVFGEQTNTGAFAEYISVPASACAKMPEKHGFTQMACLPIAGVTALQAIVDQGKLQEGETVLINGSSGGVGHLAIQIAKAHGASVTAVCSSKNIGFVQSLGADKAIAYDEQNIHSHSGKYDVVIDNHGNLTFQDFKRMGKRGVSVGFTNIKALLSLVLSASFSKFKLAQFTAQPNTKDLEKLADLLQNGKIRPHIEKEFPYDKTPEAIAYIESMRTKGKVAVVWDIY